MAVKQLLETQDAAFAGRVASNKKIKERVERILKLRETLAEISADIKSEYDAAANEGIDRVALKQVVKLRSKDMGEEIKLTINSYLKALGDLPLFAVAELN